jgi:hypothetical protein
MSHALLIVAADDLVRAMAPFDDALEVPTYRGRSALSSARRKVRVLTTPYLKNDPLRVLRRP